MTRARHPLLRRFARDTSGATAVEFAIVSVVFVIFCLGLIDFGRNIDAKSRMSHAADAAARALFLDKTATEAQVMARIQTAFPTLGYDRMTLGLTDVVIDAKPFRRITVTQPLRFLTPGFSGKNGTITVRRLVPAS